MCVIGLYKKWLCHIYVSASSERVKYFYWLESRKGRKYVGYYVLRMPTNTKISNHKFILSPMVKRTICISEPKNISKKGANKKLN